MGTENPGRPVFPVRPSSSPFAAGPPPVTPFSASGPAVGPEPSGSRPATQAAPQTSMPFTSSVPPTGSAPTGLTPNPSMSAPPTSYVPSAVGSLHQFPTPLFQSQPQAPPAHAPPFGKPSFQPSAGHGPLQPPLRPQTVPGGAFPSGGNVPRPSSDSSFFTPRPNLPASFPPGNPSYHAPRAPVHPTSVPGYIKQSTTVSQGPPTQPPFQTQQGNFQAPAPLPSQPFPQQGGFVGAPPAVNPYGQHPGSMPPIVGAQGLAEDFKSLSVGSIPGAVDSGLDPKALPRPLDVDVEPAKMVEPHSMNCDSRYMRFTTSAVPNSQSLLSRWHLPLGAVVTPLAEAPDGEEVPVINFISTGIIRCRRCRAYVNPYVTFTDVGRKWRCNICSLLNDVPGDYFSQIDATGRRIDLDQRPELTNGSVEFVAPTEYMVRPPMPPLYFFLIDVSVLASRSGMLEVVAQTIRSCLDDLPGYPRTQIAFITYDSTIHFYNMKSSLTQAQMMVVSDLDDIFVPLPDDLLVNLSESKSVVETFLDSLPSMFQDNMNVESAFGPALKAAFMIMSRLGGKLLIFQNTVPSLGVGRLKLRGDDPRVYGTDKEHALRIAEDPFYKQMASDFTKYQIGVNIYAFSDKYTDIASLGTLAKYTGGQVYYYPGFQSFSHGEKLKRELARDLTRETAWEAVMRIRCGKGIRFTSYHGNFMLRSADIIALPSVDCDKAYAMQLGLEETLLTTPTVYFQVALLYTASCGERRIRVHTAALPVVSDLGEMYRQADTGAIVSVFCRQAIEKTLSHKLEDARSSVQLRIVKALREYRNLYAVQHRLASRIIYPESLKCLILYGLALCKSTPLRGGYADVQLDERSAAGFTMMALPVKKLLKLLYPSLVRVDDHLLKPFTHADEFKKMESLPLSMESLDSRGLYLYDDGFRFVLWFGKMLSPDMIMNLLGPDAAAELSKVTFGRHDTVMSSKPMAILDRLRESDRSYYQLCNLVRQGEQPREGYIFLSNLVEDQVGGTNSYVDWMLQIHRQVQRNG